MNTRTSIALIVYAALLVVVSATLQWIERETTSQTLLFSCAASALCLIWGVLGLLGSRRLFGPGLTLGVISFALLSLTITRWVPLSGEEPRSFFLTILITIMLFVTLGLLAWLLPREDFRQPNPAGVQKKQTTDATTRKSDRHRISA